MFLRCLQFANEVSLVCTILDCFLYENIISWETNKASWLTLEGTGFAPPISNEHKLKRENEMDSCWQSVEQVLLVFLQGKTDFFFNLFFTRWYISINMLCCFYNQDFGAEIWEEHLVSALWIVKCVAKQQFYMISKFYYTWIVILLQQRKIFHACSIVPYKMYYFSKM